MYIESYRYPTSHFIDTEVCSDYKSHKYAHLFKIKNNLILLKI